MNRSMPLRRLKLHRSTLVLACLLTLLATILVVPGITVGGGSGGCRAYFETHPEELIAREGFVSTSLHEHGWPWVFLRRQSLTGGGGKLLFDVPWLSWSAWTNWSAECNLELSVKRLIGDLLIGLSIILMASLVWEWRLRRRNGLFRLRIADILAVATFSSLGLGWHAYQTNVADKEKQHIEFVEDDFWDVIYTDHHSVIDDAMGKLFGSRQPFRIPYRATRIRFESSLYDPELSLPLEKALPHLKALKALRHLEISYNPEKPNFLLPVFAEIPQLRSLQLWGNYIEQPLDLNVAKQLVQYQQIKQLILYERDDITSESLELLAKGLPQCEVVFVIDDPLAWSW